MKKITLLEFAVVLMMLVTLLVVALLRRDADAL